MKKVIYLLVMVVLVFTGCNPLDDINEQVDAIPDAPNVGAFEYTLTADDYAALELNFGSFNSEDQAKELVPSLLTDLYPLYGQGSSVLVNYDLFVGAAEGVSDYTSAQVYQLSNSDYAAAGSDAFGFYPNVDASDKLADVLDAQIATPTEGKVVLAKYKQYTENPVVGLAPIVEYNFAGSLEGWAVTDLLGTDLGWSSQAAYAQGNGYSGGQVANIDWLISPDIDLTGQSNLKFQIKQAINFAKDLSLLKILVSTNYDGDVTTATWSEINLATAPAGNSNDMIASENYDFSAYDGQMINVAFKYESTDADAARWRIESMAIKTLGATGTTVSKGEHLVYTSGNWDIAEDVYYLSSSDYDSMGTGSGQPGRYNNFSSSIAPDAFLPTFLNIKYPYAMEDDVLFVIYDYFSSSSGAQIRGNEYTVVDGVWTAHKSVQSTSLQFGYDSGTWVPDNTIRYTLQGTDYTYIGTNYASVDGFSAAASSAGNYGNFDRRSSNPAFWSDTMLETVFADLLSNVIAPGAANDQKYVIIFDIYNGASGTEQFKFIKTDGAWVRNE
ncbi:uncharacterized protein DUF5017 [Gelidibacter algens]|uniref:Uncharacterized protein DUF5017 n=2 Tax=Gelidibacter algens TaxID=49280 RepID=A0A327S1L5_9FLAO|nr:choice-of-anchor J domain-containing protein [Gelidibacter algens]RAJ23010.1 uncharacterized protein DUF5017 [Gelidibacter algens]